MKERIMYEAEDGTTFKTKQEAFNYEKLLEHEMWYNDNKLYGSREGCRIEWVDLCDWLQENDQRVFDILRRLPTRK